MDFELQHSLLDWFQTAKRPLPWREHYGAYEVWISEVMLQQTQVKTMLPYYERWMHSLPTLEALAMADEEVILKLWEGLGYYSRARNLKKAAQVIVNKHGGVFPKRVEDLQKLPGIGPYTASAIASIAFQEDLPVVDGNVIRVLSRLDDFKEDVRKNVPYFWARAQTLLPKGHARDFNQGLMELGALLCTPRNPKCSRCPLQKHCQGFKSGRAPFLPFKTAKAPKQAIQVAIGIVEREGKVFVQKRAGKGLMAGLWEFPGGKLEAGESFEEALIREMKEETGLELQDLRPFMSLKHSYTRYSVDLHCYFAQALLGPVLLSGASQFRWIEAKKLNELPFPAANVKIIERYLEILRES